MNDARLREVGASQSDRALAARKKLVFGLVTSAISLATIVAGAELFARLKGFRPWTPTRDRALRVHPGGRFGTLHPVLGNAYLPGRFWVTLADGYSFRMTHDQDGLRITRSPSSEARPGSKGQLWIFGCSYTHGWALNDEETYPWLLQERLPDYEVFNFGVGGYGTLQSLLQFREALGKRGAPQVVVVAYGSFHDARNTLNRYRMKGITPPKGRASVRLPCARLGRGGELEIFTVEPDYYRPWPLQGSLAFVHFLEEKENRRELLRVRSHSVSKAILDEFKRLADRHGARLVVAGIYRSPETADMLNYARNEGIDNVDISVRDIPEFQNLPHDAHPNAQANRRFAVRLAAFLSEHVLEGHIAATPEANAGS